MTETPAASRPWRPRANPWLIAISVTSASFMEVLDSTIVNVALPHIAGSLSAGTDEATWTLTSYLVANGIILPISGWIGSVLGRKRYFLICIVMFTLCSFLCGLSTALWQIVLFRALQGLFGGGLQPNQQAIILDTFEPSRRGAAFSVTAVATVVAPILGPTLGGLITDHFTWRWIFFINVPVGIAAWFAVMRLVEDPPWAKAASRVGGIQVDYTGLALIAIGLGALEFVLDRGEQEDWLSSPLILPFAVVALLGIVGAVCWLLTAEKPVVNLRVLANRNFAIGAIMIFTMAFAMYSTGVLIPQMAQSEFGYNATLAGFLMSPGAFGTILLIPIVGRLLPRIQARFLVAFGFVSLGGALAYASTISPEADFFTLASLRLAMTLGMAFLFVPISTIAFSTLPQAMNRDATSLYTMFRNIAGSIGIALTTTLVTRHGQMHQSNLAAHLNPFNQPYLDSVARGMEALKAQGVATSQLADRANAQIYGVLLRQSVIQSYIDVFVVTSAMAFCIVPLAALIGPIKGGRRPVAAE
jgi:DHA2 family multidrug resistance protein